MSFLKKKGRGDLLRNPMIIVFVYLLVDTPFYFVKTEPPRTTSFLVTIDVDELGNAKVAMNFTTSGAVVFSTFLPVFQNWTKMEHGGHYSVEHSEVVGYFYNRTYFKHSSEDLATLLIEYNFSYAAIYSRDNAWFMSPMLGNDVADTQVVVNLTNFKNFLGCYPTPVSTDGSKIVFKLPSSSEGQRVFVEYKLSNAVNDVNFTRVVKSSVFTVRSAPIYDSFIEQILNTFEKAYENLSYVFGTVAPRIEFQFYLPKELNIGALGYVRGEDVQVGKGPINVNLVLIRFKPGYLEQVVLHEYIHLALGECGVEATGKLRWFHEGVAEYISGEICKALSIETDVNEHLVNYENYVGLYGKDISFIEDWDDEQLYYSLAYTVIKKLGDDLGGISFYKKTFYEIKREGGVSNLQEIVEVMSMVADRDLSVLFREWGFDVRSTGDNTIFLLVDLMPAIVIWILLMMISVILVKRI